MAEYHDREHFIPIRCADLIDLLCAEEGLAADEVDAFRRLCRQFAERFHVDYFRHFQRLKDAYAPFDPDADTKNLRPLPDDERQKRLDTVFAEFDWLLGRANFRRLSDADIEAATAAVSDWGINMDVDFDVFERFQAYYRGDTTGRRTRRRLTRFYRKEEVEVPVYRRMVLILKQREHKRLGKGADTRSVFVKLFKDIPKMDAEMLLPGAELRMPLFQRGKLGASLFGSVGFVGWKLVVGLNAILLSNPMSFVGPLGLVLGYGYRQWAGFQSVRRSYSLQLTQSLYYQNLDNNAGVFHRLLDAAEEQECREAILAYFFLWREAGEAGWTPDVLDDHVEEYLHRRTGLKVDFEIGDALEKLVTLKLVETLGDAYRAVPLTGPLARLGSGGSP